MGVKMLLQDGVFVFGHPSKYRYYQCRTGLNFVEWTKQKEKKTLTLHGWEQKNLKEYENENTITITCFGDRTSGTFLIIASVSQMNITRSHELITL